MGKRDNHKPHLDLTQEELIAELQTLRAENAALKQSERLLRAVIDGIDEPVYAKDEQGRYLVVNTTTVHRLGHPMADILGKRLADLVPTETARRITDDNREIMDEGTTRTYEDVVTLGGVSWPVLTTKTPYRNENGQVIGLIGISRDITTRKLIEEALRQHESLLAEAQQLAHIGSWNWDITSGLLIWSDEHYCIVGLKPQEIAMTFDRFVSFVHPDDRATLLNRVDQQFRDHKSYDCCWRVVRDDGSVRFVHSRGQVVIDEEGKPVRMFGTIQDITERRRNEEAIEETQRRFRAIFENSTEGLLLVDDNAHCVDANPAVCQFLGYSRDELLQMSISDLTPVEGRERLPGLMSQLLAAGTSRGEYTVLSKDGSSREVEFCAVANILPGLHLTISRNITEFKRTEETLARQARLLEITYDSMMVRNPDNTIAFWNRGAEVQYGWKQEEAWGCIAHTLLQTQFPEPLADIEARFFREGQWEGELVHTKRDGSRIVVASRWVLQRDQQGHPLSILEVNNDITEHKRTEEALKRSESLLAEAQHFAQIGSWSWEVRSDILMCSDEHYHIFGLKPQEMVMTLDHAISYIHPDDRATVQDRADQAFQAHQPYECCVRVLRRDGTERIILSRGQPVYDESGNPARMFGTIQDITEQRQAEEALRASEQQFRAVFEGAMDAMVVIDDGGRYVDANPAACELFGLPREQLLGKRWDDFTEPGFDVATARAEYLSAGSGQGSFRLIRPDASARATEYAARANILPGRHLSILRDVTDRKQAEEALRQYAERLAILHEIDRTILATGSPGQSAQTALERLGRIVPSCCGNVTMFDLRTRQAFIFAATGVAGELIPIGVRVPLEEIGADDLRALVEDREFVADDLHAAEVKRPTIDGLPAGDIRSYARVPLTTGGQLLGSLNIYSYYPFDFKREHINVAREVANSLAIAIRQARLFEEVRTGRERLADLSRRLIRAEEAERRRIALELHDEIGQALTALKLNLKAVIRRPGSQATPHRLEESVGLVERTIAQVRNLSLDLRPALLDDLGLIPALRSYVGGLAQSSNIETSFVVDEEIGRQDPEIETACYRIAQEALTNVARHSEARTVRVELEKSEPDFRLVITDDGAGFNVAAATARAAGGASLGLLGMRERALLLGGDVEIASEPGRGTRVQATFRLRLTDSGVGDGGP